MNTDTRTRDAHSASRGNHYRLYMLLFVWMKTIFSSNLFFIYSHWYWSWNSKHDGLLQITWSLLLFSAIRLWSRYIKLISKIGYLIVMLGNLYARLIQNFIEKIAPNICQIWPMSNLDSLFKRNIRIFIFWISFKCTKWTTDDFRSFYKKNSLD